MNDTHRERPIGLWAITIIAILLGLLGSCGSTLSLASLAAQDQLMEMQEQLQQQQPNAEVRDLNLGLQRRTMAITAQWKVPNMVSQLFNMLASLMLLVAAVLLLRWHPSAPTVFFAAAAISIVADLVIGGLGAVVQREIFAAMEEYTSGIGAAGGPGAERMVGGVTRASMLFGICWALGWLGLKIGFYLGGIVYLRKRAVRALFG